MSTKTTNTGEAAARIVTSVAAVVGLGCAAALAVIHYRLHTDPAYVSFCGGGGSLDCDAVAASRYSVLLGLPLAVWGLFGMLAALSLVVADLRRRGPFAAGAAGLMTLLGGAMALASVVLGVVSATLIGAACPLCLAYYATGFAFLAGAWLLVRRRGGLAACLRAEAAVWRRELGQVVALKIASLAVLALAWALFPRYWELASYRDGARLAHGTTAEGLPWLGAVEPRLTVHEYVDYECPHCQVAHRILRRALAGHPGTVRVVRHDFARLPCAVPAGRAPGEACVLARGGICADRAGRFWDWNDAVLARPRPLVGDARASYPTDMARTLGFDVPAFERCLADPATAAAADAIYREGRRHRVVTTPAYVIDGQRVDLHEVLARIADRG